MTVDVRGSPLSDSPQASFPFTAPTSFFTLFLRSRADQFAALADATPATPSPSSSPSPATHFSTAPTPAGDSSSSPMSSPGGLGASGSGGSFPSRDTSKHPPAPAPAPAFTPSAVPVPEKCFTFCSQRAEESPMCRMFCLRMRQPLPSQKEQLARLNGATHDEHTYGTRPFREQEAEQLGFFERMRRNLAPYSIVVLKGSHDGVAGRYMEEMDFDDGNYDFGPLSRHAPPNLRRKAPDGMSYMDWGPAGYLLYLPLTSVFWPILNLPQNVERVVGPPVRLLQRVGDLIQRGVPQDLGRDVVERMVDGRGLAFGGQVWDYVARKGAAYRAQQEERWAAREEQARQQDPHLAQRVAEVEASKEAARVARMGKDKEDEK